MSADNDDRDTLYDILSEIEDVTLGFKKRVDKADGRVDKLEKSLGRVDGIEQSHKTLEESVNEIHKRLNRPGADNGAKRCDIKALPRASAAQVKPCVRRHRELPAPDIRLEGARHVSRPITPWFCHLLSCFSSPAPAGTPRRRRRGIRSTSPPGSVCPPPA